ncbi:hypothetical protein F2Q69_00039348 [Brassica cretica]|uniref:Uncharacterized protein n=1 Tax=Brassica cretica TaxID=69181 RepID=A0A8S9NAG0_BRACR|nr:hypothetical protein F2Q69_00039348 [Brassica cretica]
MKEIKEEEERARREQTLKSVLVTPSRDFVITRDGNKVPVSELDRNWGSEVKAESLVVLKVSLVCLSFRACSQEMISSWSKPFLESQFLILRQLTSCTWRGEVVYPTCNADGEPRFYKENQMMKCSACYGRGLNALKDGSDSM